MPKYLTQEEAFLKCEKEGKILIIGEVDLEKIKTTVKIAEGDIASAKILKENLDNNGNQWNSIYKLYYDALHELAESFLQFDKVKVENHRCLFAYLCFKHPELELSWDFFEKIRTKRNGISYYGAPVSEKDWKEIKVQIDCILIC